MTVGLWHATKSLPPSPTSPIQYIYCDYRLKNTTTITISYIFVSLAILASIISRYSLGFLGITILLMRF